MLDLQGDSDRATLKDMMGLLAARWSNAEVYGEAAKARLADAEKAVAVQRAIKPFVDMLEEVLKWTPREDWVFSRHEVQGLMRGFRSTDDVSGGNARMYRRKKRPVSKRSYGRPYGRRNSWGGRPIEKTMDRRF